MAPLKTSSLTFYFRLILGLGLWLALLTPSPAVDRLISPAVSAADVMPAPTKPPADVTPVAAVMVIPAPPQDQGLPYTRSARARALAKIQDEIAVFAGSRYGYVHGYKVRLDPAVLRGGEATLVRGAIMVPATFAGVLDLKSVSPEAAPDYLKEKWVYDLNLPAKTGEPIDLAALARSKGLKVYQDGRGLLLIGANDIAFSPAESVLKDSVITLFDTPEKYADPDIATHYIPTLSRQGKMTEHVKVTPEELANLNGPVPAWPTAPSSSYDLTGFNRDLLGSQVPPPGVYPRLLFSPEDVPMLAARVKQSELGQKSLIEMKYSFQKSWWDPATSDGQIFQKLVSGETAGLEFDSPPGASPTGIGPNFKGEKNGIFSTHVAYVPECLTAMALYCLLTDDDAHGKQAASAIAHYYALREPLLDTVNAISDSEFGSSLTAPDGTIIPMNGNGSTTHWRTVGALMAHMNLGLSLDFGGKWMTAEQKDLMRRVIAKACYGRRSYGQDAPVRFRDVNWVGWDLTHFIANQEIEGLEGFDPEVSESGMETVRSFCDWGIDNSGVVYESDGKTPGSFQFITLSMVASARRGQNYFGHPHLRKLLTGQIQMTSPSGEVTVNSGTQYAPYSRQALALQFVDEQKAFFPNDRRPDFLLSRSEKNPKDDSLREWSLTDFNAATYEQNVGTVKRLRLPSATYPGFANGLLYCTDYVPTTREDLKLPLDFDAPVHGDYSSYSDRSTDAAWMNLLVRPDHYLGAGHHHADAGMFHFSALGVDWFTMSPFDQEFSGKYFDLVQVDGHSEPEPLNGGTAYNAAAKYLGAVLNPMATAGTADLTDAYSYRWLTQPPPLWPPALTNLPWELEPAARIQQIFAGTARYKLREWWSNNNYSNYIATSRAPFNPMQYVYRTTGLIRGAHPYGFVVDDLKKDEASHLYQWVAMLSGGVWQADVADLPGNMTALAYRPQDHDEPMSAETTPKPAISPAAGEPLLLVCAPNLNSSGKSGEPIFKVETLVGPPDRQGKLPPYDRLSINSTGVTGEFRVLLLPYRQGDPLPKVSYDPATQTATVQLPDQSDQFSFKANADHRTRVTIRRGGETLLESK